jgi:hypothetical protein
VSRRAAGLPASVIAFAIVLSCVDIPTAGDEVLSFQFDPLPSPAVVAGDSLRDSLGVVKPLSVLAFNYSGGTVTTLPVRFTALDSRIRVDSVSGIVLGDSASSIASRVLARVGDFAGFVLVPVTHRPDTVIGSVTRDTLEYSVAEGTSSISGGLGVRVLHGPLAGDTSVRSMRVTFDVLSPADTAFARLVDELGRRSRADTTDAGGIATRRIMIDVLRLTAPVDSVIVSASVRYRGQHVKGSPVRMVLHLQPR